MAELQQNRYDKLLRRVGGLIGPGSKVSEVITELFPMFDVENMPAELLALSGTRVAFGGGVLSVPVANAPTMQLFNPVGSGMLMTLTKVILAHGVTSTTIRWGIAPTAMPTAIDTQTFRDTRFGLAASSLPVGQIRTRTSAALANATGQAGSLANTPFQLDDENGLAILIPGSGFEIGIAALNSSINVTFYWRERTAEVSELNF